MMGSNWDTGIAIQNTLFLAVFFSSSIFFDQVNHLAGAGIFDNKVD